VIGVWRIHGRNMVTTKSLEESIRNLQFPQSVADYGASIGIDLESWRNDALQNLIAAMLVESKKKGRLFITFFFILSRYPSACLRLLFNFSSVVKHLKPS
jgi:hypothetical protein